MDFDNPDEDLEPRFCGYRLGSFQRIPLADGNEGGCYLSVHEITKDGLGR